MRAMPSVKSQLLKSVLASRAPNPDVRLGHSIPDAAFSVRFTDAAFSVCLTPMPAFSVASKYRCQLHRGNNERITFAAL
jgi:hypothetical protein